MATLLSRFESALGDLANFDVDDISGNDNDTAIAAYIAKVEQLEALLATGGGLGCLIGCYPEYLQCRKDNPSYPPQAICDAYLDQCIANCQQ